MESPGQPELITQIRVIKLFKDQLGYTYRGNWHYRENNRNVEVEILASWLKKQGIQGSLIKKALRELDRASALGEGKNLYDANKAVYEKLRYGVKVKEGAGKQNKTVWLIDWENPEKNDFSIAEEVSIRGENRKRPDIVLYVNGIALGVIELKRAAVSVSEGIRQNLDNQKKTFIRSFFTTMQLVMAGNDTEGLRYGTIETHEKHFYQWKDHKQDQGQDNVQDKQSNPISNLLDRQLCMICEKRRFLEIIHDFIVFDAGTKKTCRHNQYFGVRAAQKHVQKREGGIIWHTQGSGKSLTMVWLAKWIREHVTDARVLVITDRTELDEQIEKVFKGVDEGIYRTKSGADLMGTLNKINPWLICSLVHKFGSGDGTDAFIAELQKSMAGGFIPRGELFVFVDECHRTQSGKLRKAMKAILPNAMFVGFTGTPLLKSDKEKSIEVFGSYIHTYKFNEAVKDLVVLDLRYEARDIDQYITSQVKIDQWFEAKTAGLSDMAKFQLKQKWGTMKKVLSSHSRLGQIVNDILMDMAIRPRLMDGRGNAMLVCASIYQACKVYELFSKTDMAGKCAIITSYKPSPGDIKGEESGEGMTEKLHQYDIYRKMLASWFEEPEETAMYKVEEFEKKVKERFINEPGQMRLLIVVDKLLTGFDAPPATYLYIDKQMKDHGLFQAICRINRLDGDDKEYGYIIDYKDLFCRLEGAIGDYTSGALDGYDQEDVKGLLTDRLEKAKEKLEAARETIKALCEPVLQPKALLDYLHYFCGETSDKDALRQNEPKRVALYKAGASLFRAYANLANELTDAGYTESEGLEIKKEVEYYSKVSQEIKLASSDYVDMKLYEPAMRHLLDTYIHAKDSETMADFEELGLIDLLVNKGLQTLDSLPGSIKKDPEAMAETIENNMRKVIIDENPVNPAYYELMSELLEALIKERKEQAIEYRKYLEKIKELAERVVNSNSIGRNNYPASLDTSAKQALYDNLGHNEALALEINGAVLGIKKEGWIGNRFKEREVAGVIRELIKPFKVHSLENVVELVKNQDEYK